MLAASTAHPRLTDHAGDGWPLHYRDDRLSTGAPQASLIAVGTAPHLVGRGMRRRAVNGVRHDPRRHLTHRAAALPLPPLRPP
ncbi:hypothetical protein SALBM135S_05778 [Streptomyces alboniger]